jgi:hypothetical protein
MVINEWYMPRRGIPLVVPRTRDFNPRNEKTNKRDPEGVPHRNEQAPRPIHDDANTSQWETSWSTPSGSVGCYAAPNPASRGTTQGALLQSTGPANEPWHNVRPNLRKPVLRSFSPKRSGGEGILPRECGGRLADFDPAPYSERMNDD